MKKLITLATSGIFLLSLQGLGWAQKEVNPPAVPPMLEEPRPFQEPEAKGPVAPKTEEQAKPKVKARSGQKAQKKAKVKKSGAKAHLATSKKKGLKTSKKTSTKKKKGAAKPQPQAAPDKT